MEIYLIIITATITAITLAYEISKKISSKTPTDNIALIPIIKIDSDFGISLPVGVPGDSLTSNYDTANSIKASFKIKEIDNNDIEPFTIIAKTIDWETIIKYIIREMEMTEIEYQGKLSNRILIQCIIETEIPINAIVEIANNGKINIL